MKKFKIKNLTIENFKGFANLNMEFNGSAIILGGMNGFGKTTIFDAIELLLTGKIQRFEQYSEKLHLHSYKRSQKHLPLVNNDNQDIVSISATLEIDNKEVKLKRCAKVTEMKNPVDFTPFECLEIYDNTQKEYRKMSQRERDVYGINNLEKDYCFLNYLSQEESTAVLKCKEDERSDDLQNLFETQQYDNTIEKTDVIIKSIDKSIKDLSKQKQEKDKDINKLQKAVQAASSSEYISISNNNAVWDLEHPKMSDDEFEMWLKPNGIIDQLLYYIENEESFKQYNRNEIIHNLLSDKSIDDIVFYEEFKDKVSLIESFIDLQKSLIEPILNLASNTLLTFNLSNIDKASSIIKEDIRNQAWQMVANYIETINSSNAIQRMVQELLEARTILADKVKSYNPVLKQSQCPLCGSEYEDFDVLTSNIKMYQQEFENKFATLNNGLNQQFTQLKQFLVNNIIHTIEKYYNEQNVSKEIANRFSSLNEITIKQNIEKLNKLNITIKVSKTESDLIVDLKTKLAQLIKPITKQIDIKLLSQTYFTYAKYIKAEMLTTDNIEKKKNYLTSQWNGVLTIKQKEIKIISTKIEILEKKKKELKDLKNQLIKRRNNYVTNVISDIQILFYIYSGRILQDSYFGRGLFIKPEFNRKRVLFIYGNYDENDVDAIYNISSGQLVAVAIAYMLSLNKLYSTNNLIAIDDPIQTIDDINLWGLMETLRHDFKDCFIMLSTHETNYGQLMDYKFKKIGIQSEYIDMKNTHK